MSSPATRQRPELDPNAPLTEEQKATEWTENTIAMTSVVFPLGVVTVVCV